MSSSYILLSSFLLSSTGINNRGPLNFRRCELTNENMFLLIMFLILLRDGPLFSIGGGVLFRKKIVRKL